MQRDTRSSRVAHPSFILEADAFDPDVRILSLSRGSTSSDEDAAHVAARQQLGQYSQRFLFHDELYDVFELSASVDYRRTSDFASK